MLQPRQIQRFLDLHTWIRFQPPPRRQLPRRQTVDFQQRLFRLEGSTLLALAGVDDFGIGLDQLVTRGLTAVHPDTYPLTHLLEQAQCLGSGIGFGPVQHRFMDAQTQLGNQVIAHHGELLLGASLSSLRSIDSCTAQPGVFDRLGQCPALPALPRGGRGVLRLPGPT